MRAAIVMVLLVFVAPLAYAQQPRAGDRVAQDRREAIKKRIRVLRAATLTDELNLDEKTLSRLLPTLAKWDDVTEDLLKKRVDIQRRLSGADGMKDPKAVDRLVDEAVANQKAFWDLEDKRLVELRKILNPAQIARLLIVLPAFERKIQNQLRRAINRGQRNSGDDDDLDLDDAPHPRNRR
ncbi:MAG: hypothetical protein ABI867_18790 [Kofleriaceae bacterium]